MARHLFVLAFALVASLKGLAQGFEWTDRQESMQAGVGQTLRIPIRIKNTSDKAQFFVIRKAQADLNSNQKGYFCLDDDCLDQGIEQFSKRIEPGETLNNLYYTVETGLVTTNNTLRFEVFAKASPGLVLDHTISLAVDEKPAKSLIFQSRDISIHDVYPNPIVDQAFIDYRIYNEQLKAKVVIHNILGVAVGNYEMPVFENKVKIQADDFVSGVYFYTLYLDNVGVLTRKMIVRK